MADHTKVYGICENKCRVPLTSNLGTHADEFINTAKSYLNQNLKYGDYTPFSDTPELFMNCSTLIGFALRGIPFNKSPYYQYKDTANYWDTVTIEKEEILRDPEKVWTINPATIKYGKTVGANPQSIYLASQLGNWLHDFGQTISEKKVGSDGEFLAGEFDYTLDLNELEKGDIIFWSKKNSSGAYESVNGWRHISHVAIYIGKNKSGNHEMIESTAVNKAVRIITVDQVKPKEITLLTRPPLGLFDHYVNALAENIFLDLLSRYGGVMEGRLDIIRDLANVGIKIANKADVENNMQIFLGNTGNLNLLLKKNGGEANYMVLTDKQSLLGKPLSLASGGLGRDFSDLPNNAILRKGQDTQNIYFTETGVGAFYADAANGIPKFGTLPANRGGTGVTTGAESIAIDKGYVTTLSKDCYSNEYTKTVTLRLYVKLSVALVAHEWTTIARVPTAKYRPGGITALACACNSDYKLNARITSGGDIQIMASGALSTSYDIYVSGVWLRE